MGESTKAVCAVVMVVGIVVAAVGFTEDGRHAAVWAVRIAGLATALLALGFILKLHFRADVAHDYLRSLTGTYFNRDGFCFSLVATAVDGIAHMGVYYQSQGDKPCVGRIAVRPTRGFFMTRAKIALITYEIECPAAGFGYAWIAIPIPQELQGKRQSFEVGASVRYPEGKGQRLRFHDGIFLRSNTDFGKSFHTAIAIAGIGTGSIALSKPATATVDLPLGVAEDIPADLEAEIDVLWQLGDPPLEETA